MNAVSVVLTRRELDGIDALIDKGYARSRADFVRLATVAYITVCNDDWTEGEKYGR